MKEDRRPRRLVGRTTSGPGDLLDCRLYEAGLLGVPGLHPRHASSEKELTFYLANRD